MKVIENTQVISKIVGLLFIIVGYCFFNVIRGNWDLFEIIVFINIGYFFLYIGIYMVFSNLINKVKVVSFIYNKILALPIIIVFKLHFFTTPILSIIMFLVTFIAPSLLIIEISNYYPIIIPYLAGIIYMTSLVSVLLFAYKGNSAMVFITETFKPVFARKVLYKYSSTYYTRIISYILMIIIYCIYNIDFLAENKILTFVPIELLTVIKEVFVTFVAVDTLFQMIINNKNSQSTSKGTSYVNKIITEHKK